MEITTNKQLLEQFLYPDEMKMVLENTRPLYLERRADDRIEMVLSHAFWWRRSPQGHNFWKLLSVKAQLRQDANSRTAL